MKLRKLSRDEICQKVREQRRAFRYPDDRKLTQETLAECLGVEPTFISKLENGKLANLNIDILQKIAEVLGITVNDLCYEQMDAKGVDYTNTENIEEAEKILRNLEPMTMELVMKMLRGVA